MYKPKTITEQWLKILTTNSKDIKQLQVEVQHLRQRLIEISITLHNNSEVIKILDERTTYIPRLYEIVDSFMGELLQYREELPIISNRLKIHETRITKLEQGRSIK